MQNTTVKGGGRKLGGDGFVNSLHGGEAFMVCSYSQTHQVVYIKYVQLFTYQSYLNKVFLKVN